MKITKRILWTITWIILVNYSAQAQGWERRYDFDAIPKSDLMDIFDIGNNEHILIGTSSPDNLRNTFLIKINESGDTLWLKKNTSTSYINNATLASNSIIYTTETGSFPNWESQIQKVDLDGNLLWVQNFASFRDEDIIESIDGGIIMIGHNTNFIDPDSIKVNKLDSNGNLIWQNNYFGPTSEAGNQVVELPDGSIVIAGNGNSSFILLKLDSNGNVIWKNYFPDFNISIAKELILTANNEFIVMSHQEAVARFDGSGNLLWVEDTYGGRVIDMKELPNGNLALTSQGTLSAVFPILHHLSADGVENWRQSYIRTNFILGDPQISCTVDGGFLIGTSAIETLLGGKVFPMVFKVDSLGEIYNSQISGEVWNDENDDCLTTLDETGMEGWIVAAANSENTFYGIVGEQGTYKIQVDTGNYIVSILEPFDYWEPCMDSILQTIMPNDTIEIDFPMQGIVDCPLLTVDVASYSLTRCFDNTYYVNYCNQGTIAAEDAFIEIDFDPDFQVDSASLMWSAVSGNTYTFDLGDLPINTCGNFEVYTTLDPDCDATVLGETHCVEAHIFPDSFCIFDPAWDESSIEVDAVCDGDSIRFQITNIGVAPMSEALEYIVIEDNVMRQMGAFELDPGQTEEIPFLSTGATVRLEADQASGHPGVSMPNVTVEGCDPDGDGIFSLGYYTKWPDDDGSPNISIDCQQSVGSYDPNDKTASPTGVTEQHFIRQNTDIEYKIRFQNIGSGDAMTVVVLDTLSPFLDISTLQLGASSHRYQFEILTNNVLKFTFEEINLPPESVDEAASQGFVKFRISQVDNNPIGTIIYNSASIFFDRNDPIITNTTYHEIGEDFIEIILTNNQDLFTPELIKVTPNPFSQTTLITVLEGGEQNSYSIKLLNSIGQVVRQDKFSGTQYLFQRNNLGEGLYIFNIENDNNIVATGKMIIQ